MEYDARHDAYFMEAPLPLSVRAFVQQPGLSSPVVVVNARLSEKAKRDALRHELCHIKYGDIHSSAAASDLEAKDR